MADTNVEKILEAIRIQTEKNLELKRVAEIKRLDQSLNKEKDDVAKILGLIHDNLLYKKDPINRYGNNYHYEIVTEKQFFKDYTTEPENSYISKGIVWNDEWNDNKNCYRSVVSVNGNRYFDMRYIIWNYEDSVHRMEGLVEAAKKKVREVEEEAEKLHEEYPRIIKMMHKWADEQEKRLKEEEVLKTAL